MKGFPVVLLLQLSSLVRNGITNRWSSGADPPLGVVVGGFSKKKSAWMVGELGIGHQ